MSRTPSDLVPRVLSLARRGRSLARLAAHDVRAGLLANVSPTKPRTINFLANDICNSRCQMCLIWQRKRDFEVSPDQLRRLLTDPLFDDVRHVGMTGGEPTLRGDLAELASAFVESCEQLESISIITNAIRRAQVMERTLQVAEVCARGGVAFTAMVSLDGVGATHDLVRGRRGNFGTAIACIDDLRAHGIDTSFGCTVTRDNAAHVDELLDYALEHGIYGRFRIAEHIDRLYNAPQREYIRNFDARTVYHLQLFFTRAERQLEQSEVFKRTYRNIRAMLGGAPRSIGCPYQADAVVLTSRAELLYCSPKSPVLGTVLEPGQASRIYFDQLPVRQEIRQQHCDQCIHDYHAPVSARDRLKAGLATRYRHLAYDVNALQARAQRLKPGMAQRTRRDVLIVGWYGTETAGDKAILGGIVAALRARPDPPSRIRVSSLNPFVTERTRVELDLPDLEIVETYTLEFAQAAREVDEVIMGGGPLMDLDCLDHVLHAFLAVRERDGRASVWGCGVGPLRDPRNIAIVRTIFGLATEVRLRDAASVQRAALDLACNAERIDDPAIDFVRQARPRLPPRASTGVDVACFLRSWPHDYAGALSHEAHRLLVERLDRAFATAIARFCGAGLRVGLYAMHCFDIGDDDRVLNRRLARAARAAGADPTRIECPALPGSPDELLAVMQDARFNLCMRYHSVVFAHTLGRPFLAIDYTQGGKIPGFLQDVGATERLLELDAVLDERWSSHVIAALKAG